MLDEHLARVRAEHPDIRFATATEAVLEFLDYYTPNLRAIVDPRLVGGDPSKGRYLFGVHLLGNGIFVDPLHPATLHLAAPACFLPSDIANLEVMVGNQMAASVKCSQVSVDVTGKDQPLTLAVDVCDAAKDRIAEIFFAGNNQPFYDFAERNKPDLFRSSHWGDRARAIAMAERVLVTPERGSLKCAR